LVVDVSQLVHAAIVQLSGIAQSWYLNMC